MKKSHLTSTDLFRDIKAREIYNVDFYENLKFEHKGDVDIIISNTRKFMNNKLENCIVSLGVDSHRFKDDRGRWSIPIEEEEYIIRAYIQSTSPAGKKLRGIKKGELEINEIHEEIKSMEELIDKKYDEEESEKLKGALEYTTNYKILEKISQVKEPINQMILESMEHIVHIKEDEYRWLNMDDAVYLIEFYHDLIERTTKMWHGIIDTFAEIRNSENELGINTDESLKDNYEKSEIILEEAIKEYNQKMSKENKREKFTEEQMKAVKEVLESFFKARK